MTNIEGWWRGRENTILQWHDTPSLYSAFGMRIRSPIALPELEEVEAGEGSCDVTIELGPVGARLADGVDLEPGMQVTPDAFQLDAPRVRCRVSSGSRVTIDRATDASSSALRLYLLGTVMGALCLQRGILPLHAAVLGVDDQAVAFAGPSGAGKSTLAAQLRSRGWTVMADDLCAIVTIQGGSPQAVRGVRRIKLWADSLNLAQVEGAAFDRVHPDIEKFSVPIAAAATSAPLRRLYVMRPDAAPGVQISRISGPEALAAVLENTFNWSLAVAMGRAGKLFAQCSDIATNCAIFELRYTLDATQPSRLADVVQSHAKG